MAYQFDNAVTLFGLTIENALQERQNVGTQKEPKWEPKYTLKELLDNDFRLPRPVQKEQPGGLAGLKALVGVRTQKVKA